jgi:cardiolipin synthase
MADKLLLTSAFIVLTVPGTNLVNRVPLWLTIIILSRDIAIVLTVAIVNLAIGPRTFKPSRLGKVATATYIVTALAFMVADYLRVRTPLLDVCVYASAAITIASGLHYITYVARVVNDTAAT